MKSIIPLALIGLTLTAPAWVLADEGDESPAVNLVPPAHFARPQGHRPFPGAGKIIDDYIHEQAEAGKLDPTEFDKLKTEQQALRDDIKSMREAGDEQGLRAKLDEARSLRETRQRMVRDLVDNDAELRARLQDHRAEVREHRREHRDLQRERLRQRDQASDESRA